MIFILITYVAGVLTILSPCILPVLPFVFARSGQPFLKSSFPLLVGLCTTFALLSAIAITGGEWVANANQWGRYFSILLLSIFGLSMIFPEVAEKLMSPLVKLGSKIGSGPQPNQPSSPFFSSFLIGISTGLLWAPCAGPILGLVLTGAASQGNTQKSILLLFSYSLGAATSLALALIAGNRFLGKLKQFLGIDRVLKRILGISILVGVVSIIFNLDRTLLTHLSKFETTSLENKLISFAGGLPGESKKNQNLLLLSNVNLKSQSSSDVSELPEFNQITAWINSKPLLKKDLLGKVVLIDFWTYSCINCIRTLPYLKEWSEKYKENNFIIVGIHAPEFAFEKNLDNVKKAVQELGITYPVAIDNDYALWSAFQNHYWPAHFLIDREGKVRSYHFGEGNYEETEKLIQTLIAESGEKLKIKETKRIAQGVEAQGSTANTLSPETYLGFQRASNLQINPPALKNTEANYQIVSPLKLNEWSLGGTWKIAADKIELKKPKGKIAFRFRARDLHLVLGGNKAISFKVTIDGHAPGNEHGTDTTAEGLGVIRENRLYQLIRETEAHRDEEHLFEITFFEDGVEAYAFTFG